MSVIFPSNKLLPICQIREYPSNARTHSAAQVAQIAASVREWGWTNPLIVDEADMLIAGHGRLAAAQQLGMAEVPAIVIEGLSDAQKRALRLADNKLALNAGWDDGLLRTELEALRTDAFDLALTGFGEDELASLFADRTDGLTDPDAVPEPPAEPITRTGDVWLLGRHRLVCGDCREATIADAAQADRCDLLLSDPPYGIGYEYVEHDDRNNDESAKLVADAFALGPMPKVWTPGLMNLARDINRLGRARVLVWNKKFAAAGNGLGGSSVWEPILVVGHTPARKLNSDVIEVMTDRETLDGISLRKLHTCPKPVALYAKLAEALSNAGQALYEPFSGSGTTIIAAEMTGRACHAIEISPQYCDVSVLRWQAFTGQTATNPEGAPFGTLAEIPTH